MLGSRRRSRLDQHHILWTTGTALFLFHCHSALQLLVYPLILMVPLPLAHLGILRKMATGPRLVLVPRTSSRLVRPIIVMLLLLDLFLVVLSRLLGLVDLRPCKTASGPLLHPIPATGGRPHLKAPALRAIAVR